MDYDDHSITPKEMKDLPVDCEATTWRETNGGDVDDNATSRVNDPVNETERKVADAYILVGDRVVLFMTAFVYRAYTRPERTNTTKVNTDGTASYLERIATTTDRTVANAVGPHFIDYLFRAFIRQTYVLPEQAGVQTKTVGHDDIVEPDTGVASSANTTAEETFGSSDGVNRMAISPSQPAE